MNQTKECRHKPEKTFTSLIKGSSFFHSSLCPIVEFTNILMHLCEPIAGTGNVEKTKGMRHPHGGHFQAVPPPAWAPLSPPPTTLARQLLCQLGPLSFLLLCPLPGTLYLQPHSSQPCHPICHLFFRVCSELPRQIWPLPLQFPQHFVCCSCINLQIHHWLNPFPDFKTT